ncbi:hypothetical protein [Paraliobacillus sp. JSM ZJ581]|uniref:hypothetical protein n=1 Tax=Paraliobacillus sp. JSM ZJ581 TaxID=3342118 RepID=UPI0035A8742A
MWYLLGFWGLLGRFFCCLSEGLLPITDILSGFILGALIDLYILIKKRNVSCFIQH